LGISTRNVRPPSADVSICIVPSSSATRSLIPKRPKCLRADRLARSGIPESPCPSSLNRWMTILTIASNWVS
jgi:hypothetical protein